MLKMGLMRSTQTVFEEPPDSSAPDLWIAGKAGQQQKLACELASVLSLTWRSCVLDNTFAEQIRISPPKLLVMCDAEGALPKVAVPQLFLSQHDPPRAFHLPGDAEIVAEVFTAVGTSLFTDIDAGAQAAAVRSNSGRAIFVINNGPALTTHRVAKELAQVGMAAFLDLTDTQTHVETLRLTPRHRKSSQSRWRWNQIQANDPPARIPQESSLVVAPEKGQTLSVLDPRLDVMGRLLRRSVVHCGAQAQSVRDVQDSLGARCIVVTGNGKQDMRRLGALLRNTNPAATTVLTLGKPSSKTFQTISRYRAGTEVLEKRTKPRRRRRQLSSFWSSYEHHVSSSSDFTQRPGADAQAPRWRKMSGGSGGRPV